jgi:hypothetical protein
MDKKKNTKYREKIIDSEGDEPKTQALKPEFWMGYFLFLPV